MCRATVSFVHLLFGLHLPALAAILHWRPAGEPPAAGAPGAEAAAEPAPSPRKWAGRLHERVRRAEAAADAWLHRLLGPGAAPAVRAAVCWYVLAQSWLLCRLAVRL